MQLLHKTNINYFINFMKKLNLLFHAFLAAMVLILVSCEPEPEPVPVGPSLDWTLVSEDSIENGGLITFSVTATKGDELINRLEITENGALIDNSRVTLDGDPMGANPSPIASPNDEGFTWDIVITASDQEGVNTYGIKISDAGGLSSAELTQDIITFDPVVTTPVSEMTMILLKNQGGPAGTGGVDLHTGVSTGTSQPADSIADIADAGIDTDQPIAQNWIQRIEPINGSIVKVPDAGFDYDVVETKEEIMAAYDLGTEITLSDVVSVGDQFLVRSGGTLFAVKVTNIVVTVDDNQDYYELSVKQ
jgi:hypothetical protein